MKTLIESNPYLRDPQTRRRWIEENARDSCVFEGARGLKPVTPQPEPARRRSRASGKKPRKSS